jgi:tRNA threonylcarbamoyladenosine biosynthesis protein TsaE
VPDDYAITSPTFTLINEYPGHDCALYHMDVYRLGGSADLAETGFEEYLLKEGIVVIEWAENVMDVIPDTAMIIELSYGGEQVRQVTISDRPDRISSLEKIFNQGG